MIFMGIHTPATGAVPLSENSFFLVAPFASRISRLDEKGHCVIGIERRALLPLILFDLVLNVSISNPPASFKVTTKD